MASCPRPTWLIIFRLPLPCTVLQAFSRPHTRFSLPPGCAGAICGFEHALPTRCKQTFSAATGQLHQPVEVTKLAVIECMLRAPAMRLVAMAVSMLASTLAS